MTAQSRMEWIPIKKKMLHEHKKTSFIFIIDFLWKWILKIICILRYSGINFIKYLILTVHLHKKYLKKISFPHSIIW